MVTHTGEKTNQCSTCDKYFTTIGNLNTHLLVHTGEKPYPCEPWGKFFSTDNTMKVNMVTHIGENTCKKYFTTIHVNFVIKRFLRNYDWLFILLKKS